MGGLVVLVVAVREAQSVILETCVAEVEGPASSASVRVEAVKVRGVMVEQLVASSEQA